MASINVNVNLQTREALYKPHCGIPSLGLVRDMQYPCWVFGLFQCSDGDTDVNPYFVIELQNGQCTYAAPECITFTDVAYEPIAPIDKEATE